MTRHLINSKGLASIGITLAVVLLVGCDTPPPPPTPAPVPSDSVGIAGVAGSGSEAEAAQSEAAWDRFLMRWLDVQTGPDEFHPEVYADNIASEPLGNVLTVLTDRYPNAVNIDLGCVTRVLQGAPTPFDTDGEKYFCGTYQGYTYNYTIGELESSEEPLIDDMPNPNNPWAKFIYVASDLYDNDVSAWEIFNEHESAIPSDFDPRCNCNTGNPINYYPPPKLYAQLIRDAIEVLEATNGTADQTVLAGAWTADIENYRFDGWYGLGLQELLNNSQSRKPGIIGLHAYGRPKNSYRYIVKMNSETHTPLWLTEIGVRDGNPDPGTGACGSEANPQDLQPCARQTSDFPEVASYVVQQYVWALQGFRVTGEPGKVFYYNFKEDNRGWGLLDANGNPRPSYKALQFIVRTLQDTSFKSFDEGSGYVQAIFERTGKNERIIVLWAIQSAAIEVSVPATKSQAQLYDQFGNLLKTVQAVGGNYTIPLPGATHPYQIPGEGGETMIGGAPMILIESEGTPTGDAEIINYCDQPDQLMVMGYDPVGLESVTVRASPPITYDLSWTEPGQLYMATFNTVPLVGATWYFTLTNKLGVEIYDSVTNYGDPDCPGGGPPDDNFSAASSQAIPEGLLTFTSTQQLPRVALLNRGFAGNAAQLLFSLGEPALFIEPDFDPVATLERFPALIIPSGGLYGTDMSVALRARLEAYARLGGAIIAFDQQLGVDYAALPSPPGGGVGGGGLGGYGWTQDMSCFINGFALATSHPILSGFDKARLNLHGDGYFTSWPASATVLLRRTANGQPGAIVYPYGDGWVFATTVYDDWGAANGQIGDDARILARHPPAPQAPVNRAWSHDDIRFCRAELSSYPSSQSGDMYHWLAPGRHAILHPEISL